MTNLIVSTAIEPRIYKDFCWRIARIDGVAPAKEDTGFQRTRLLKPISSQEPVKKPSDLRSLHIANVQLNVPPQETTYWCRVVRLPEHFIKKHHVLQVHEYAFV